jgi:hypothetical protein
LEEIDGSRLVTRAADKQQETPMQTNQNQPHSAWKNKPPTKPPRDPRADVPGAWIVYWVAIFLLAFFLIGSTMGWD